MGATSFEVRYRGKNMSDAYYNAVSEARHEDGHDPYNGTISTTHGVSDVTAEYKRSGKTLSKFVDDNIDRAEKWGNALGICIKEPKQNTNKIQLQVKHIVTKGAKKWVLYYVVKTYSFHGGNEIAAKRTKTEALKVARAHTEKTREQTSIVMEKRLEKVSNTVAEISYKGSSNEQLGEYLFFGWAAC